MNPRQGIVLAALLAIACGKSKDAVKHEIVERHRADVERIFAAIERMEVAPLPEATGELDYKGPPLTDEDTVCIGYGPDVVKNMRLGNFTANDGTFETVELLNVRSMLDEKRFLESERALEDTLTRFGRVRHVVIVKTLSHDPPHEGGGGFVPGHVVAEAHLFDISGKHLGAFRFEASSSRSVKYTEERRGETTLSDDREQRIREDFETNAQTALLRALVEQIPGSTLPVPYRYLSLR